MESENSGETCTCPSENTESDIDVRTNVGGYDLGTGMRNKFQFIDVMGKFYDTIEKKLDKQKQVGQTLSQRNKELRNELDMVTEELKTVTEERDKYLEQVINNTYKRKAADLVVRIEGYKEIFDEVNQENGKLYDTVSEYLRASSERTETILKRRKTIDPPTIRQPDSEVLGIAEPVMEEECVVDRMAAQALHDLTSSSVTDSDVTDSDDEPENGNEVAVEAQDDATPSETTKESVLEKLQPLNGLKKLDTLRRSLSTVCGGSMRAAIDGNARDQLVSKPGASLRSVLLPKLLGDFDWEKKRVKKAWEELGLPPHTFSKSRTKVTYGAINAKFNQLGYKNEERNEMWANFLRMCPH